jgi:hypothetical protein
MKRVFLIVGIVSGMLSCTTTTTDNKAQEGSVSVLSEGESDAELAAKVKAFEAEEKAKKEAITSMSFDKMLHDFGNVKPESDNTCKFKVTNTGKKPLIIEKVSASCGCTTPHKPEGPILPGQSDYIEVGFHPKPGQVGEISKTVTIEANTDPILTDVQIKAFVK